MSDNSVIVEPIERGTVSRGRPTWQVVVALFLVALTIRLIDIGGRSLWVDEGATYVLSRPEVSEILADRDSDPAHPPGYYALIHFTSKIDDSEAGLRIPSALVSALTVIITYLVGRRLGGPALGLLAAAFMALSPLDLWFAQEARQPVFAAAAVVVAGWGLLRGKILGSAVAVIALSAGLYLDYITAAAWFGLGGVWLALATKREDVRFRDWALVTAIVAAVYIPFQGAQFSAGFDDLLTHEGASFWYGGILGSNRFTSSALGLLILGGLVTALVVKVSDVLTSRFRASRVWASLIVAGFGISAILMPVPRAFSVKKVIIVGWPVVALIVAFLLLHRVSHKWVRPLAVGVLALSMIGVTMTFFVPKDDWRGATAHINANASPEDVAWFQEDVWAADAYIYYEGELPAFHDTEPAADLPADGEVWLVTYRRPQDPVGGPSLAAEAWFDDNWLLVEEIPFYRLAVRRYQAP